VSRFTDWLERLLGDPGGRLRYARERAMVQAAEERAASNHDGLRPCPFCGDRPHRLEQPLAAGPVYSIDCLSSRCSVQPSTDSLSSEASAIAAWNRRAGE
jgi:Lar family restriction alleviation protein